MFTINYKGVYIHGYANSDLCSVQFPNCTITARSLQAAKVKVTKFLKKKKQAS